MAAQENPRMINTINGSVIEINSNPFTLGRGLCCNYIIAIQSISRIHCILEKINHSWVLKDTSTNGTFLNGELIKDGRSPPLKDNDVIDLDRVTSKYLFQHSAQAGDISDEQLCRIADSLLNEVEDIQNINESFTPKVTETPIPIVTEPSIPIVSEPSIPIVSEPANPEITDSNSELLSIECGLLPSKRLRLAPSSTEHINNSIIDLTNDSFRKSMNLDTVATVNSVTTDIAGPSKISEESNSKIEKPNEKRETPTEADNREELEDEMQCSICSEMFVKAVTLNCAHTFCKYCIELWSKNKMICPICRTKITSLTPTLVLDNVIEMVVQNSSEEIKQHRKQLLEERQKCLEQPPKHKVKKGAISAARGVTNNQSVIEVSSSSDSDASTISDSDWQEEYSEDGWYERGYPGHYYGGYGHCFTCGRRGHWANGCPYR